MSVRVLVSLADAELTDIRKGSVVAAQRGKVRGDGRQICCSLQLDMPQNAYEAIVYVLNM